MEAFCPGFKGARPGDWYDGMYTFFLHRLDLPELCRRAERAWLLLSSSPPALPLCEPEAWPLRARICHGRYIHVMLAHPIRKLSSLRKELALEPDDVLLLQTKHDGERIQLHVWHDVHGRPQVRVFSRGGRDSTGSRALALEAIRLSLRVQERPSAEASDYLRRAWTVAHAAEARRPPVRSCILDGEILVYNEREGAVEPFGTVQGLQERGDGLLEARTLGGARHFVLVWFDCIELDGSDFLARRAPLTRRLRALHEAVTPLRNFVSVAPAERVLARDTAIIARLFAESRLRREEGLMLKAADSPYVPNQRSRWGKLKHDRIEGLGDEVTAAIVGARWGKNGRAGALGEYAVAVTAAGSGSVVRFKFLFNVECGLSDVARKGLDARLLGGAGLGAGLMARLPRQAAPPAWLAGAPTSEDKRLHVALRDPDAAIAVDLLGSGFVAERGADRSKALQLRHPRITRIRWGEPLERVMSADEYQRAAARATEVVSDDEASAERWRVIQAMGGVAAEHTGPWPRPATRSQSQTSSVCNGETSPSDETERAARERSPSLAHGAPSSADAAERASAVVAALESRPSPVRSSSPTSCRRGTRAGKQTSLTTANSCPPPSGPADRLLNDPPAPSPCLLKSHIASNSSIVSRQSPVTEHEQRSPSCKENAYSNTARGRPAGGLSLAACAAPAHTPAVTQRAPLEAASPEAPSSKRPAAGTTAGRRDTTPHRSPRSPTSPLRPAAPGESRSIPSSLKRQGPSALSASAASPLRGFGAELARWSGLEPPGATSSVLAEDASSAVARVDGCGQLAPDAMSNANILPACEGDSYTGQATAQKRIGTAHVTASGTVVQAERVALGQRLDHGVPFFGCDASSHHVPISTASYARAHGPDGVHAEHVQRKLTWVGDPPANARVNPSTCTTSHHTTAVDTRQPGYCDAASRRGACLNRSDSNRTSAAVACAADPWLDALQQEWHAACTRTAGYREESKKRRREREVWRIQGRRPAPPSA